MNTVNLVQETKQKIGELLDTLPQENLVLVQRFVEFLREQAQEGQPLVIAARDEAPPYRYPTVENPASSLNEWLDLIPDGCRIESNGADPLRTGGLLGDGSGYTRDSATFTRQGRFAPT